MNIFFIFVWVEEDFKNLKNKNRQAYHKLFNEFKDKVLHFLIIKTNGNLSLAEEIVSDTFFSAIKTAHKLKNNNNIQAWLINIASRRLADYFRKHYREKKYIKSVKERIQQDSTTIQKSSLIEKELEKKQEILMLNTALENVNKKYKKILKLKFIEKKSNPEIADELQTTLFSANNLLLRAKKALKKEFEKLIKDY